MKTTITKAILILAIGALGTLQAQEKPAEKKNLIINGSFEEANAAKLKKLGQLSLCNSWTTATGEKVDLFSRMATFPEVGAPDNTMGICNPKDGNNYVGITTHLVASKDGREYITAPLDGYLEKDKKYCLSYSISLADAAKYATNNLGFHFSKKPVFEEDKDVILLDDVVYPLNNKPMTNSENWENVCVTFTAAGYEKFVTIGNFASSTRTVTEKVDMPSNFKGEQQQLGYYFLDNISLVEIGRESECTCDEEKKIEGPRIIFSKTTVLSEKASIKDKVEASTVYFYSNEDELAGVTTRDLDLLVEVLSASPDTKITVSGHMDKVEEETGKEFDKFRDLSKSRAEKVKEYLVEKGISGTRILVESHKADAPATQMTTPLSMARNRRVEFTIR